jgi:hypothetical protein
MIASRSSSRVFHRCRSSTFCSGAKKDTVATLSPHAPTRPIEPAVLGNQPIAPVNPMNHGTAAHGAQRSHALAAP